MDFGHILKHERELRGWSQARLAEELGTTLTSVSRWERGLALPSPHFRQQLSELLGKNAQELKLLQSDEPEMETEAVKTDQAKLVPNTASVAKASVVSIPHEDTQRQWLLNKVRRFWIHGALTFALRGSKAIDLVLQENTDAVENPWQLTLHRNILLPCGHPIIQVYDDADGELLILGEPGSGKTTLLLELTDQLVTRAELDITHPIPVIFNLSSWGEKRQPILNWLIEELHRKYQIPLKLSQNWIESDQILPLLDGLDEIKDDDQAQCIQALNLYRQQHGLVPTVICSRSTNYFAQEERLLLHDAVVIQPLTKPQIEEYLSDQEEIQARVQEALHNDPGLQELITTPLMLTMLISTFENEAPPTEHTIGSLEERRKHVFATYVQRMLKSHTSDTRYTYEQTTSWLAWLAKQMQQRSQTEFFIEQLQADWLVTERLRLFYSRMIGKIIFGVLFGIISSLAVLGLNDNLLQSWPFIGGALICGLLFGLLHKQAGKNIRLRLQQGLLAALIFGVSFAIISWLIRPAKGVLIQGSIYGIFGMLLGGLLAGFNFVRDLDGYIRPVEAIGWSWTKIRQGFGKRIGKGMLFGLGGGFILGICIGLIIGLLTVMPSHGIMSGLLVGIIVGLPNGIFSGLFFSLWGGIITCIWEVVRGLTKEYLPKDKHMRPNEGIRRSLRNSLLIGGMSATFILLLSLTLNTLLSFKTSGANTHTNLLIDGLASALFVGLVLGLRNGGEACIQHATLRLLLWRAGYLPINYPQFLDYAVRHSLLYKIGSGYIFAHGLLLDYFASLEEHVPTSVVR